MKALMAVFLLSFVSIAHAAQDARCECSDYWSGGYTFRCEGRTIQFIGDKQAGDHLAAKALCEKAQSDFLQTQTRIVCKDPKGAPTRAELTFNNQQGQLAVTYPDGHSSNFSIDKTEVSDGGTFENNFYTYRFAAYSTLLGPAVLVLDVNPRFWTDDMSNKDYFDGYGAKLALGINTYLICDLYDVF